MTKFEQRRALLLGTPMLALAPCAAWAQDWPARPIRLVVPFPPGGPTDRIGRLLADRLGKALGQPVVIDNVGGAGGTIGMARVAKAAPDGYTLGLGATSTQAISTFLYDQLSYDPLKDFTSISKVSEYSNVLLVNAQQPIHTVKDLIALALAKPGQITFGSAGTGTSAHLSGELFQNMAKIKVSHVPYKGAAAALTALLAGDIVFMFDILGTATGLAESGRVRILASTGHTRLKQYPDLPTVAETVPDYEVSGWFAVFGPPGLPEPIVEQLNREIGHAMADTEVSATLLKMGYESAVSSPAELNRQIEQDLATWGPIVRATNAKAN